MKAFTVRRRVENLWSGIHMSHSPENQICGSFQTQSHAPPKQQLIDDDDDDDALVRQCH